MEKMLRFWNYYAFDIVESLWKTHENAERTGRFFVTAWKASVDKGTRACGRGWNAACGVIVLDLRQQACVLCLAGNAPAAPASPSEFFAEDKRRLARQTRQAG